MVGEALASFLTNLRERITSPVFGSFAASWCIVNWQMLVVLFCGEGIDDRIVAIHKYVFNDSRPYYFYGCIVPATSMLFYVFAYPFIKRQIKIFTLKRVIEMREDQFTLEKSQRLSLEESNQLREELKSLQHSYSFIVTENTRLESALGTKMQETIRLTLAQEQLLYNIASAGNLAEEDFVPIGKARIQIEADLDILINSGYVDKTYTGLKYMYSANSNGRQYLRTVGRID